MFIFKRLIRYFLQGLLVVLPIFFTAYAVYFVFIFTLNRGVDRQNQEGQVVIEKSKLDGKICIDHRDWRFDQADGHKPFVQRPVVTNKELHRHGADQQIDPIGNGDQEQPE